MKKSKKPVEKLAVTNRIKRQYALSVGYGEYKLITIFADYSIAVGCKQKLEDKLLLEVAVTE